MPDSHNFMDSITPAKGAVAGAVAGVIVSQLSALIYEKITGDAYSESDRKKLNELKRLYEESFQLTAPVNWELDSNHCPTHRVKSQKWSLYIKQLLNSKRLVGHYHYQSNLIAEYASTYLIQRGKRWFGSGKLGDLIEQFLGDWIHFALNDLPTFGFEEEAIQKIKQRIKYIEQVQKHENIFQFGIVTRQKNKLDTIESIKQQLQTCLEVAAQELLRQCARDKFNRCRSDITALLLACVQTMYYGRQTDVHYEPLELLRFIEPDGKFLTVAAKDLYAGIKVTYTGSIMAEVISLGGLESFGTLGEQKINLKETCYYDENFKIKPISWDKRKSDFPIWVTAGTVEQCLNEFQQFGESILRVAKLKKLVEDAYDLTGKIGDLWAYGDTKGKLSLKALLFLLEKEINLLKKRFDVFYHYHNTQRHIYNLQHRINPAEQFNPNFNKVDAHKENIEQLYQSIINSSASLKEKMVNTPSNMVKRIDAKKHKFYQSLVCYLKNFYPDSNAEFNLLEQNEQESINKDELKNNLSEVNVEIQTDTQNAHKDFSLIWPLKFHSEYSTYLYLDKPEFKPFFISPKNLISNNKWQLGQNYGDWINGYFVHNTLNYQNFQSEIKALQDKCNGLESEEKIDSLVKKLQNRIKQLRQKVEDERPAWRFKFSLWPIRTKGWPFNRGADRFAELLLKELDETLIKVQKVTINHSENQPTYNKKTNPQIAIINNIPKDKPTITNYRIAADQWFDKFKVGLMQWENNQPSIIFHQKESIQQALQQILTYRNQLSSDEERDFIKIWQGLKLLISLELLNYQHLNPEIVAQMYFITRIIEVMEISNSGDAQKIASDEFNNDLEQMFMKKEMQSAVESYLTHGLLKSISVNDDNSKEKTSLACNELKVDKYPQIGQRLFPLSQIESKTTCNQIANTNSL
jgi:hypothetical protein